MAIHWRKATLLGGVALAGMAAGALGMLSLRGGDGPYAASPAPYAKPVGAPASTALLQAVAGNCELAPMLPAKGDGDGRGQLQSSPAKATANEVGALILQGKEAAAAGRQRDAEVAFLNACRNAAALGGGDGIPLADALYQLGRHYATVGAFGEVKSPELFQRAERLYSASLEAYRARYGEEHEKTRFAREGLTTVQQATGGKAPAVIAKAAEAAPEPAPEVQSAAPAPIPAPAAQAISPAPVPAAAAQAAAAAPARAPARQADAPTPARASSVEPPPAAVSAAPVAKPKAEPSRPARPEARAVDDGDEQARERRAPRPEQARERRAPSRPAAADAELALEETPPVQRRRPPPLAGPDFDGTPDHRAPPSRAAMGAGPGEIPTAEGSAGVP